MSDTVEEPKTLKAGHPPATKVSGGMRITQNKLPTHEKPISKNDSKSEDDEEEPINEPSKPMICTISGAPIRGNEDFPASSVKAFHEKKPMPTNECRPSNKGNHLIHQPKK